MGKGEFRICWYVLLKLLLDMRVVMGQQDWANLSVEDRYFLLGALIIELVIKLSAVIKSSTRIVHPCSFIDLILCPANTWRGKTISPNLFIMSDFSYRRINPLCYVKIIPWKSRYRRVRSEHGRLCARLLQHRWKFCMYMLCRLQSRWKRKGMRW